jgi:MFS family permease
MLVGQMVMVGIMTMTPLHMSDHGHGLTSVGFVISAHAAGMFAFSPISASIVARLGEVPTILAGLGVLAASALLAAWAPQDGGLVLLLALFLLGYGWNLGFLAGTPCWERRGARGADTHGRRRGHPVSGSSAAASLASVSSSRPPVSRPSGSWPCCCWGDGRPVLRHRGLISRWWSPADCRRQRRHPPSRSFAEPATTWSADRGRSWHA